MQAFILGKHNSYRNNLAGGNVNNFKTASAMTEMVWDTELAALASKNAMQCIDGHDKCRNTVSVPNSGQNIGQTQEQIQVDSQVFAGQIIDSWWNELSLCPQSILDNFGPT